MIFAFFNIRTPCCFFVCHMSKPTYFSSSSATPLFEACTLSGGFCVSLLLQPVADVLSYTGSIKEYCYLIHGPYSGVACFVFTHISYKYIICICVFWEKLLGRDLIVRPHTVKLLRPYCVSWGKTAIEIARHFMELTSILLQVLSIIINIAILEFSSSLVSSEWTIAGMDPGKWLERDLYKIIRLSASNH